MRSCTSWGAVPQQAGQIAARFLERRIDLQRPGQELDRLDVSFDFAVGQAEVAERILVIRVPLERFLERAQPVRYSVHPQVCPAQVAARDRIVRLEAHGSLEVGDAFGGPPGDHPDQARDGLFERGGGNCVVSGGGQYSPQSYLPVAAADLIRALRLSCNAGAPSAALLELRRHPAVAAWHVGR